MKKDDEPSVWKRGVFYFNPQDRRLFPPKRSGLGWTINFANPFSVLAFAALIIIIIAFGRLLS